MTDRHLAATPLADHDAPLLTALIEARGWRRLPVYARIGAIYDFVRDEVPFGYNRADDLPASQVLADGYGQCNTKGTLLLALLRGAGVPARVHGATIHKALQRGAIPDWLFPLAPKRILHSWVEVALDDRWVALEGFILDAAYLAALQARFAEVEGPFCGYGAATPDLHAPEVAWRGQDTWIQRAGLADDFGVYDDPDAFFAARGTNLRGLRRWLYERVFRHAMNRTVGRMRASGSPLALTGEPAL